MANQPISYESLYALRLAASAEIRRLRALISQSECEISRLEMQQTDLDAQAVRLERASLQA